MNTARTMSLRLRLFFVIVSPLLAASVLLGFWRVEVAQKTAAELFDRGLLAAALAISRDVAISEGDALSPRTRQLISDAGGGELFYHVTGPGGIYVTGYAYPPTQSADSPDTGPVYRFAEYRNEPVRVLRMSETTTLGNLTGETVVTVWQRVSDRQSFVVSLVLRAIALMAALMATLAIVVWFGVEVGLRPLKDLRNAIEQRSPDDLTRIKRRVPAEVTQIVATLNRLLDQVDDSIKEHQAFISDAAHQLRNPASSVLSLAETLSDVRDPEEKRRREQDLIGAARKSARLTEQLLSLERLRYGALSKDIVFDLNSTAETVCADIGPEVLERDLAFAFERHPSPLRVMGDPVLVGEALGNLIENAMRHGGPELSEITVRTRRIGNRALVDVSDDGRGLLPEDSDTVFRRFSQLASGEGSGLGLAIVKQVVQAHGGTLSVEKVKKGACIAMRLPLQSPQSQKL